MLARLCAAIFAALFAVQPVSAEVVAVSENGFITRDEAVIDATPKQVWLELIAPGGWWNSAHTWSGDATNLTIRPQAGGCFCERIPEDPDPDKITLEGSVEHMRVIQAYPERALRMQGALGPLQSEPVIGILTIAISEVDEGTRVVWEYAVGGQMRFELPVISQAVDGVMTQQLTGLAEKLGVIRIGPEPSAEPEPEAEAASDEEIAQDPAEEDGSTADDPSGEDVAEDASVDDVTIEDAADAESVAEDTVIAPAIKVDADALDAALGITSGGQDDEPTEEPKRDGPSVDEAFGDLLDGDG